MSFEDRRKMNGKGGTNRAKVHKNKHPTKIDSLKDITRNFVTNEIDGEGDTVAKRMKLERWMVPGRQQSRRKFRPRQHRNYMPDTEAAIEELTENASNIASPTESEISPDEMEETNADDTPLLLDRWKQNGKGGGNINIVKAAPLKRNLKPSVEKPEDINNKPLTQEKLSNYPRDFGLSKRVHRQNCAVPYDAKPKPYEQNDRYLQPHRYWSGKNINRLIHRRHKLLPFKNQDFAVQSHIIKRNKQDSNADWIQKVDSKINQDTRTEDIRKIKSEKKSANKRTSAEINAGEINSLDNGNRISVTALPSNKHKRSNIKYPPGQLYLLVLLITFIPIASLVLVTVTIVSYCCRSCQNPKGTDTLQNDLKEVTCKETALTKDIT